MATTLAEALDQPIGRSIHDVGLMGKPWDRNNISNDFQYLEDVVLAAHYVIDGGEAEIRACGCSLLRRFNIDSATNFAGICRVITYIERHTA